MGLYWPNFSLVFLYAGVYCTSDEEELLIDKVEVWSCLLDCVILLAPLFFYSFFTDVTYVFSETKLVIYVYSKNS